MKNLIQLENGYTYITSYDKVIEGDYGIGYAVGFKSHFGRKGIPPKNYLFKHNGGNIGKINAICYGAMKVISSNDPRLIEDGVEELHIGFDKDIYDENREKHK